MRAHVRTRARSHIRAALAGSALWSALLSGCDAHELVAPAPETPAGRRETSAADQAIVIGTASLAPPPNTSPAEISKLGYYELGIALPESTWVMVHVSGGLSMAWNPACANQPPNWPCMDNSPTGSYGESPGFGGPVQLFAVANGSSSAVRLRGSGGAGMSSASAVGIFFQRSPGPLVGHVSMTAVYAHNSITGSGPASWLLTGNYMITATKIAAPFTVTESAPEPDGTRTYTAEPLPGLRFANFPTSGQFPPGAAFWSFHPGDSSGPGWQVPGCQYQLVCRYKPPVPGRMQVNAFVEWQRAIVRSQPAAPRCGGNPIAATASACPPQEPQEALKLTCDKTTPERGEEITCAASAEPAGAALEVTEWTFEGEGSVIHPEAGEEHATTWAGRMVVSGTITVAGKVNGKEVAPATAEITVRPRQGFTIRYPALPAVEWVGGDEDELPYPPLNTAPGSDAHGVLGKFREVSTSYALDEGSGPNAGWVYVPDPPDFTGCACS